MSAPSTTTTQTNGRAGAKLAAKKERTDAALRWALMIHTRSSERWEKLIADGATDSQIIEALKQEFGSGGGSQTEDNIQFAYAGGEVPRFWLDSSSQYTTAKPTLQGEALARRVRKVLQIPQLAPAEAASGDEVADSGAGGDAPANPFLCPNLGAGVQAVDSVSRLHMVKKLGVEELRQVIAMPDVQKTVRAAAERRLKQLEKEQAADPIVTADDDGSRAKLVADLESSQRGRFRQLRHLIEQLEDGSLTKRQRNKLDGQRRDVNDEYERAYEEALLMLDGDSGAILEVRERVESPSGSGSDADGEAASAHTGIRGGVVEHTPASEDAPADGPRVFTKEVEVTLNDHDIAQIARKASLLALQIEELEAEKKETADSYKARIGGLEEERDKLMRVIRQGRETRDEDVFERRDYDRHVVETVRAADGSVVETRPMRPTEYQLPLVSI